MIESWRKVWRSGFAPILPTAGLRFLADLLRTDDPRLRQGCTTSPPPLICVKDWPCEGGCFVAACGMGIGLTTVGEIDEFFHDKCFAADTMLKEPAGCRRLLNWFDDAPRGEIIRDLLPEVERELARREGEGAAA